MSSTLLFFRALASNPMMVGAIAPSGPALADLITSGVDPSDGPVLELGPGTGTFTEALLARGIRKADLTHVEFGSDLLACFSYASTKPACSGKTPARLGTCGLVDGRPFGYAISGLPLLNMSPRKVAAILTAVFTLLREGGALCLFTYGVCCPVPRRLLDCLSLKATLHGRILWNFPPARVYRIVRRKPLTLSAAG